MIFRAHATHSLVLYDRFKYWEFADVSAEGLNEVILVFAVCEETLEGVQLHQVVVSLDLIHLTVLVAVLAGRPIRTLASDVELFAVLGIEISLGKLTSDMKKCTL